MKKGSVYSGHCIGATKKKILISQNNGEPHTQCVYHKALEHVKCKCAHGASKKVLVAESGCMEFNTGIVCFAPGDAKNKAKRKLRSRTRMSLHDMECVGKVEIADIFIT